MTCKDCIHYDVCCKYMAIPNHLCKDFKDKSKYIELPCKVGEKIYAHCKTVNQIIPYEIEDIHIDRNKTRYFATAFDVYYNEYLDEMEFTEDDIGQTIFLTKEEAEAKLKELNKNAE